VRAVLFDSDGALLHQLEQGEKGDDNLNLYFFLPLAMSGVELGEIFEGERERALHPSREPVHHLFDGNERLHARLWQLFNRLARGEHARERFGERACGEVAGGGEDDLRGALSRAEHNRLSVHARELARGLTHLLIRREAALQVFNVGIFVFGEREVWDERLRLDKKQGRRYLDEIRGFFDGERFLRADVLDEVFCDVREREVVDEELARFYEVQQHFKRSFVGVGLDAEINLVHRQFHCRRGACQCGACRAGMGTLLGRSTG